MSKTPKERFEDLQLPWGLASSFMVFCPPNHGSSFSCALQSPRHFLSLREADSRWGDVCGLCRDAWPENSFFGSRSFSYLEKMVLYLCDAPRLIGDASTFSFLRFHAWRLKRAFAVIDEVSVPGFVDERELLFRVSRFVTESTSQQALWRWVHGSCPPSPGVDQWLVGVSHGPPHLTFSKREDVLYSWFGSNRAFRCAPKAAVDVFLQAGADSIREVVAVPHGSALAASMAQGLVSLSLRDAALVALAAVPGQQHASYSK